MLCNTPLKGLKCEKSQSIEAEDIARAQVVQVNSETRSSESLCHDISYVVGSRDAVETNVAEVDKLAKLQKLDRSVLRQLTSFHARTFHNAVDSGLVVAVQGRRA